MTLAAAVDGILDALEAHGFCVVPSVLTKEEASFLRDLIDALRAHEVRAGEEDLGHQRVLHLAAKHSVFVDLMCHPLALAVFERYLGPDFVCSTWTSNTTLAGSDQTYWHVDHPYWTIAPPYPVDLPLTAHAIWCLDEFSEESGATKFIPGSHCRPHLPEHNGDYSHEGITIEAPPGSVVFAHGACWHSPGWNTSALPRTGIFGRFARSFIIPQEDLRPQLEAIDSPSSLVKRLLGGDRYTPQKGLPY